MHQLGLGSCGSSRRRRPGANECINRKWSKRMHTLNLECINMDWSTFIIPD